MRHAELPSLGESKFDMVRIEVWNAEYDRRAACAREEKLEEQRARDKKLLEHRARLKEEEEEEEWEEVQEVKVVRSRPTGSKLRTDLNPRMPPGDYAHEMSRISTRIYVSSRHFTVEDLVARNIKTVINMARELLDRDYGPGIERLRFPLRDNPRQTLFGTMQEVVAAIEERTQDQPEDPRDKNKVLLHCNMGVSRSGAMAVAFMMKKHELSASEAYRKVVTGRLCVRPNSGFVHDLRMYEGLLRFRRKKARLVEEAAARRVEAEAEAEEEAESGGAN